MKEPTTSLRQIWTALLLLWLAGNALRLTILAVPPVIPLIHDDLHMSATQVGILTGLPSVLLALAAVPGSLLIARTGVQTALVVALALTAIGGALRGFVNDLMWLYAMTVVMAAGVAIMQVVMPPAVRDWVPTNKIGFATAVYTNGLLFGEIFPAALTLPLVIPLVVTWQWAFAFWSAPVAIIAVLVLLFAPRTKGTTAVPASRRWWPDWNDPVLWRLGIMLGGANAIYFGINAFIPDFLTSRGQGEWISTALTALNVGQLPASAILLAFSSRLQLRAWPIVAVGIMCLVGIAAIVFGDGYWVVTGAAMTGFVAAFTLILTLALPPLLSAPGDVHRLTAAIFTISYSCGVIVPIVSGISWDLSGIPAMAFAPIAVCCFVLIGLSPVVGQVKPYGSR